MSQGRAAALAARITSELRDLAADAATDPRLALARLRYHAALLRARAVLRGCEVGRGVRVLGAMRVVADGRIAIGPHTFFMEGILPTSLVAHAGAEITVGAQCSFNYGVVLEASERITLGDRCMLGSFVRLVDRAQGPQPASAKAGPIVLENDVWLAHGAVVEPGVRIGAGSVVSAGSVVTQNVPPGHLAVGNPARVVRLPS